MEVCIGDDKDSKNSADKPQRARTDYEGPLMGTVAASWKGTGQRKDEKMTYGWSRA